MTSSWEECISTVDSLLDPNGKVISVLDDSQLDGLKTLKTMLLQTVSGGAQSHVPKELMALTKKAKEDDGNANDEVNAYLLSSFGGVRKEGGKRTMKQLVKKTMFANTFISKLGGSKRRINNKGKQYRLPEWDVMSKVNRKKVKEMLSWENLLSWNFNMVELNDLCGKKPLLFIGWSLLASPNAQESMAKWCNEEYDPVDHEDEGYGFISSFHYSEETLCNFLRVCEADYNPVPYHNNIHAADVVQTLHSIMQMGGKEFGGKLEQFALLLAAVAHDMHHPGYNNEYQKNAQTELAINYNDTSVLENMHVARTFRRLCGKNRRPELDILSGLDVNQSLTVRKYVIHAILHTDMTKHFSDVGRIKAVAALHKFDGTVKESDKDEKVKLSSDEVLDVFSFMLHVADISNPAKPAPMFLYWTDKVLEEFFRQGDQEKTKKLPVSPLCDRDSTKRAESQIPFINFIIKPTYEALALIIPEINKQVLPVIVSNLKYWEEEKEKTKTNNNNSA